MKGSDIFSNKGDIMEDLLQNPRFAAAYAQLSTVSLNPRRHTASNAKAHSDAVAAMAKHLGRANRCTDSEVSLLANLGYAHDIGKITGTARPARSLDVLAECGLSEGPFLRFVKWHDTSLPWYRAALRGQAPTDRAWRRLANEVDVRLLCIFMVADRVDAPGGWRRNVPTEWFLSQAFQRGLIGDLRLDLEHHPSEISFGAAFCMRDGEEPRVLAVRTGAEQWDLPTGEIEWDELPEETTVRALREVSGMTGEFEECGELGRVEYFTGTGPSRRLKRVRYSLVRAIGRPSVLGDLPQGVWERRWLRLVEVQDATLAHEDLRMVLSSALFRTP